MCETGKASACPSKFEERSDPGFSKKGATVKAATRLKAGKLILREFHGRREAGVVLEFATEFVAAAMRRGAASEHPDINEIRLFMRGMFETLTKGWQHAVSAVNVVVARYLMPRFSAEVRP